MEALNTIKTEITEAKAFLAAAYAKANAAGIQIPHNAALIRRRIQKLTDKHNALSADLGPGTEYEFYA